MKGSEIKMGERIGPTINPVDAAMPKDFLRGYTSTISAVIPPDIMARAKTIVAEHRPTDANVFEPLCMINAKAFIAEDDNRLQDIVKDILEDEGHSVLLTATTRDEALAAVEKISELSIDLALIDGNLNEWDTNGADGQAVLAAIRARAPHVKIVGISALSVPGADAQASKTRIEKLGEVVKNL